MSKKIPGPKLSFHLAGHANGVGEKEIPGVSNDWLTVTVAQVTTE
jgi:hypothetical protein